MTQDRKAYQAAYYEANKERKKVLRKKQPRTAAMIEAEKRYREKRRILKEIEQMQFGPAT